MQILRCQSFWHEMTWMHHHNRGFSVLAEIALHFHCIRNDLLTNSPGKVNQRFYCVVLHCGAVLRKFHSRKAFVSSVCRSPVQMSICSCDTHRSFFFVSRRTTALLRTAPYPDGSRQVGPRTRVSIHTLGVHWHKRPDWSPSRYLDLIDLLSCVSFSRT